MNLQQLAINESLLAERVGNDMVLVEPQTGQYYQLNEVATRMFEMMLAGETDGEIVRQIGQEFEADAELIRRDLAGLVDSLLDRGLVHKPASQD